LVKVTFGLLLAVLEKPALAVPVAEAILQVYGAVPEGLTLVVDIVYEVVDPLHTSATAL
jgi:hypothetical protein